MMFTARRFAPGLICPLGVLAWPDVLISSHDSCRLLPGEGAAALEGLPAGEPLSPAPKAAAAAAAGGALAAGGDAGGTPDIALHGWDGDDAQGDWGV